MSIHSFCRALTVIVSCGVCVSSAQAVIIEATFTGEVSYVDPGLQAAGAPYDQIQLTDPFSLRYVFDSETPNLLPGGTIGDATGRYAMLQLETTIGPFQSSVTPSNIGEGLIVVNDASGGDSYRVGAELPDSLLAFDLVVSAVLEDSTGAAYSNVALPLSVDLSEFDSAALRLGQAGNFLPPAMPRLFVEARVLGFESRIVPAPAAVWLALAMAGGFLVCRRR